MAKKVASKKKNQQKKGLDGIQIAGIGLIIVVVAVAVWMFFANRQPTASTVQAPQQTGAKQYSSEPPMTIDVNKQYFATVKMAKGGEFVIQLFPDKAPLAVNSFVFLAKNNWFNGVTFHRVIPGFVAQAGDPSGTGRGGPGYFFKNEITDLKYDKPGVVGMANSGPDTNGSQFFITFAPQPKIDGAYTIFGQVIQGMDVVEKLTPRDPSTTAGLPPGDKIISVTIEEK